VHLQGERVMGRPTSEVLVLCQVPSEVSDLPRSIVEVNPLPGGAVELLSRAYRVRTEGPTRDQVIRDVYSSWFNKGVR